MGLIFCDGFDHYTTLTQKYDTVNGSPSISATAVHTGTNGLLMNGGGQSVQRNFSPALYYMTAGVSVRLPTATPNTAESIISFRVNGNHQATLKYNNGALYVETVGVYRGNCNGFLPSNNTWHHVEMQLVFDEEGTRVEGTVTIRLDGEVVFDVDHVPLQTTVFGIDQVLLHMIGSSSTHYDDFYILDGNTPNNTFLGDVRIETIFPDAAGTNTNWTVSGAATNREAVDENPPNSDTDYVTDTVVNEIDTYNFAALTTSSIRSIFAVQTVKFAKSSTTPVRVLNDVVFSGSTTEAGSIDHVTTTAYKYFMTPHNTDPDTDVAWTESGVNAAEFGIKVRS